jgi:tetratricopeptide (TPR) repeat protein
MLGKGEPEEIPEEEEETPTVRFEGKRPPSSAQIDIGGTHGKEPAESSGIDLDAEPPRALGDSSSEVDLSALPKHSSRREKGGLDSGSFAEVASSDLLVEPSPSSEALGTVQEADAGPPAGEATEHEERAADALEEDAETVQVAGGGSGILSEGGSGVLAEEETDEPEAARTRGRAARVRGEEEEETKPVKPPKAGGGILGWIGGGVIGAVVAAAACIGLSFAGLLPGKGEEKREKPGPGTVVPIGDNKPKTQEEAPEVAAKRLLAFPDVKGARTSLDKYQGNDPDTLTQRAELRWLEYLAETRGKPKADAEAVTKVKEDLSKVNTAGSLYLLGQVEEATGDTAAARKTYQKGLETYPDDKETFQGALDHLDSRRAAKAPAEGGARVPRPGLDRDAEARLVLILLALQAPAEKPVGEAGFKFWEALRLANKDEKYDKAIEALDEAIARHEERRYTNLRRGLNPISDPREEIFIRSCEELKAYWKLLAALKAGKIDTVDPAKAFEKLASDKAAAEKDLKELVAVLVEAKLIKEPEKDEKVDPKAVQKGLEALATAKKNAEDEKKVADDALTAAFKILEKEKLVPEDEKPAKAVPAGITKVIEAKKACDTKLEDVGKQLADAGVKGDDLAKGIERLAAVNKDFEEIAKKLKPEYLDQEKTDPLNPKDRAEVLAGVDKVKASVKTPVKEAQAQVTLLEGRLKQAHTPQQMIDLGLWTLVLQQDRGRKDLASAAARDGKLVAGDPKADAEQKAKAQFVEGLALRNEGKFEAARKALEGAVAAAPKDAAWREDAEKALTALVDPAAYYLVRPRQLMAAGRYAPALAVIAEGLSPELFPDDGRLLALRGLVRLAQAHTDAKGQRLTDDSAGVKEARADAKEALDKAKDPAGQAAAHYALGRVNEDLGRWGDAEKDYDAALEALQKEKDGPEKKAAQARTEVAKARVLLRLRQGVPASAQEAKPAAPPPKTDKAARAPARRTEPSPYLMASNVLLVKHQLLLGLDCGPVCDVPAVFPVAPWVRQLPTTGPELKRDAAAEQRTADALTLAEAAIKSGDDEGYLLKAQALAAKDQWNQALEVYVAGLGKLVRPPRYPARSVAEINGLKYLVDNNPALMMPGAAPAPEREPIPEDVIQTSHEAEALGIKLVAGGDPQGYLVQGMAMAQRGQWKDGLRTYARGLQKTLRPAAYGNGLVYLIDHHPAFQRPDGLVPPNPARARVRYGEGLDRYWAGDYAGAERKFLEAIYQDARDARFYYYLGLSRLPQAGKRAYALDDFRVAGALERQSKPGSPAVGLALERVQGPARTLINDRAGRLPPRVARVE